MRPPRLFSRTRPRSAGLGVVRAGQISRATNGFPCTAGSTLKGFFRCWRGWPSFRAFQRLLFDGLDLLALRFLGASPANARLNSRVCARHGIETLFPGTAVVCHRVAHLFHAAIHIAGTSNGPVCPAIGGFGAAFGRRRSARPVAFGRVLCGVDLGDMRFLQRVRSWADGICRAFSQGGVDFIRIVAGRSRSRAQSCGFETRQPDRPLPDSGYRTVDSAAPLFVHIRSACLSL